MILIYVDMILVYAIVTFATFVATAAPSKVDICTTIKIMVRYLLKMAVQFTERENSLFI